MDDIDELFEYLSYSNEKDYEVRLVLEVMLLYILHGKIKVGILQGCNYI